MATTPMTVVGRLIAMALMVTGVAFFVGFAAVLVSTLDALTVEDKESELREDVRALRDEVRALRDELRKGQT